MGDGILWILRCSGGERAIFDPQLRTGALPKVVCTSRSLWRTSREATPPQSGPNFCVHGVPGYKPLLRDWFAQSIPDAARFCKNRSMVAM
jgi:hypothetical protein